VRLRAPRDISLGCFQPVMVYSYWGFRESPFAAGLDVRGFYQSANHEEVLARLHFLVDQPRRVGLLLGEAGVGKSLVMEVFARQKRSATRQVATLSLLGATPEEFLWQLAVKLGRDVSIRDSQFQLWRNVSDQLAENRYQKLGTVILLDDADEASSDVLLQVARVAQIDPTPSTRLTIVLAGQAARIGRFGRRLLELAELRIDLEPWIEQDTLAYLRWALARAGRTKPVFTPEAMCQIHALSEGVPRRVKQLADMALVAGAGSELEIIDGDVIEGVLGELGVVAAG
jgi:general secretion pathway protein A